MKGYFGMLNLWSSKIYFYTKVFFWFMTTLVIRKWDFGNGWFWRSNIECHPTTLVNWCTECLWTERVNVAKAIEIIENRLFVCIRILIWGCWYNCDWSRNSQSRCIYQICPFQIHFKPWRTISTDTNNVATVNQANVIWQTLNLSPMILSVDFFHMIFSLQWHMSITSEINQTRDFLDLTLTNLSQIQSHIWLKNIANSIYFSAGYYFVS